MILPAAALLLIASAGPAWAQVERAIHENSPYYPNGYVYHSQPEPDARNGNWASPQRWNGRGPASGMFYGYGYNPGYYSGGYPVGRQNPVRYDADGSYRGLGSTQFPNAGSSGYSPYGEKRGSVAYGWR